MANGYDFFGPASGSNAPTSPTGAATTAPPGAPVATVDRWGLPIGDQRAAGQPPAPSTYPSAGLPATAWQQPTAKRPKNLPLAIGAIVLAAAVAAGAVYYFTRSHPIPLPPSVAGMAELTTMSSSDKAEIKNAEKDLAKRAHIRDISSRVYGDSATAGYYVLAGHINGADTSLADVESQVASAAAGAGANFSTGTVTSGDAEFECVWARPAGHDVSVCFWWSNHSLLFGEGLGFDAQSTADAMAQAKTYAGLD